MHRITVRRHQANSERSHSDFVVQADTAAKLDGQLRDFLRLTQHERGKGVWSEADPEVWIEGTFIGRLQRDGDVAQLAREAVVRLVAGSVGARAAVTGEGRRLARVGRQFRSS
jgi:hypothetical protein